MKTCFDCYPCFLHQAIKAARLSGASETQSYDLLQQTLSLLQQVSPDQTPPEIANEVYRLIRERLNNHDPFFETKKDNTHQALALYPKMKALV